MKRILILIFIALSIASEFSFADDINAIFEKANEAYRNRNYTQALADYERIGAKLKNPVIYYNMANAAFKENQLGKAILYYEKARKMSPRNSDIRKNLAYAQGGVEYRVEDKRNWYLRQFFKFLDYFRLSEMIIALLAVYSLLAITLIFCLITGREFLRSNWVSALIVVLVVSVGVTSIQFYRSKFQQKAVVIASGKLDVRYGPSKDEKLAFNLVEGIQLSVDDELNDWYRISIVNGETGWVLKEGIEKI